MQWALGYCLATWGGAAILQRLLSKSCRERADASAAATTSGPAFDWVMTLWGPVWVPFALAAMLGDIGIYLVTSWRFWRLRRDHRNYREYFFLPFNYFDLHPEFRGFVDRWTPDLFQLGFSLSGDFLLKERPLRVVDRLFWRKDGSILAAAVCCEAFFRSTGVELQSTLADGTSVSTANVSLEDAPGADAVRDGVHLTCIADLPADELYQTHIHEVTRLCRQRDTLVLQFPESQLLHLIVYNQRRFAAWKHRCGDGTEPPAAVLPQSCGRLSAEEFLACVEKRSQESAKDLPMPATTTATA